MKKICTLVSLVLAVALFSCTTKTTAPVVLDGVVIDASMNTILLKSTDGDTVWLSTLDTNPEKVPGVLIDDSICVVYKDSADVKSVTELTVLKHSPYFYIQGEWVEPNPIDTAQNQGFSINQDGSVTSINMATLQFKTWNFDIKNLILSGQSIGNRQTIDFIDTMCVVKLDADSLVLSENGAVVYRLSRAK